MKVTITCLDSACLLLDINGFRILTDPIPDCAEQLIGIDLVLLSQHQDSFDVNGRSLTEWVPVVLSTHAVCKHLPHALGLRPWDRFDVITTKVTNLRITATPAQHGAWWIPDSIFGKVIGFVIEFEEQQHGVIYISGNTVYFRGIDEVGRRFKIDAGIFRVNALPFRYFAGLGRYTMDSHDLIRTVNVLRPRTIIPVHHRASPDLSKHDDSLKEVLSAHDDFYFRTVFLIPDIPFEL